MSQMDADEEGGKPGDPQTYAIIGAAMEVHRQLGHGFAEPVYQDALEVEFTERGISFRRELEIPVLYKGQHLKSKYKPDFLCFDSIVVELKALAKLTTCEYAQVINYLKATGYSRGLLVNFGTSRLEYKRFIRSSSS